jgi:cysteine sulfinate desulfinase/cysteine desulfurase-like protein
MGVAPAGTYAVLRFSFGPFTSTDEVQRAGKAAVAAVSGARAVSDD